MTASVRFFVEGVRVPSVREESRRAVASVFRYEGHRRMPALNVIWTTRQRVRALNRRFRNVRRFTDVIAFRYEDQGPAKKEKRPFWPSAPGPRPRIFGDIFIAVEQARANARRFGVPFREELIRLVTHGTLHLFGYTDYTPRAKNRMWSVQEPIVRRSLRGPSRARRPVRIR
jgi:probable rRNA maturation factor